MKNIRCAVLGAGGFIGTNLCLALDRANADVIAIGRPSAAWPVELAHIPWVEAEFADASTIARSIAGCDIVFHLLGGSVPVQSNDNPVVDIQSSLIPSVQLIQACSAGGIGRLVFVSSGGTVYGPGAVPRFSETSPTNPITAYGINKLAVEKYVGLFRHLHGLDAVVLRIANPYGPYQHRRRAQGFVGAALAKALAGDQIEIWGDGSVVRDYVYIDDVVAASITAATRPAGEHWLFNVGSGEGRSIREVVSDICEITGTPSSRIVYRESRAADVPRNVLDCTLAQTELGWSPRISWLDGLRRTAAWLSR